MRSAWFGGTAVMATVAFGASHVARPATDLRGSLEATSSMASPRAAHTATPLADGRVLLAGGFTEMNAGRVGAELYDPATSSFVAVAPMVQLRHSHTATPLPDGKILVVGGYTEGSAPVASAELFDPVTRRFTPAGSMRAARAGHVAVPLADGRVLIAGGVGPGWRFLSSAELYDPRTGTFSPTGDMTLARESHVGVRLSDGRVLIVGGHRGRREQIVLYSSAEAYEPASGRFMKVGDMRLRRHKHDAVLLRDGRVLITGGTDERDDRGIYRSTELFDPGTSSFTMGAELRLPRYKHQGSSLVLRDGTVLIAGGAPQAELFDPARAQFTVVDGDARMAGQFSAVAPLPNGGALISGGYGNGGGPRAAAWVYRP